MVMYDRKVFWDYFMVTGNVGFYLIHCKLHYKKARQFRMQNSTMIRNGLKKYGFI